MRGRCDYGFERPHGKTIVRGTPCYLRITLLEDGLFPTFSGYLQQTAAPLFRLGETQFAVTGIFNSPRQRQEWTCYLSYDELLHSVSSNNRKLTFWFLTPTSFRRGRVDFPLPDPRLIFQSYRARFNEYHDFPFLPDFEEQVEFHTGIARIEQLQTELIKTKQVSLVGFSGKVSYLIDDRASAELIIQMNLLADFAFFCGTGRKTSVGMGQTLRIV